jgi:hypothetical protein
MGVAIAAFACVFAAIFAVAAVALLARNGTVDGNLKGPYRGVNKPPVPGPDSKRLPKGGSGTAQRRVESKTDIWNDPFRD